MSTEAKHTTLLPCPFCGGEGDFLETSVWWVRCDECGADAESGGTTAEAIDAWNRRAPDPVREEMLEALKLVEEHYAEDSDVFYVVRAAIAKATGEAK